MERTLAHSSATRRQLVFIKRIDQWPVQPAWLRDQLPNYAPRHGSLVGRPAPSRQDVGTAEFWVAYSSGVWVAASCRNELLVRYRCLSVRLTFKKYAKARRLRQHTGRVRYPDL